MCSAFRSDRSRGRAGPWRRRLGPRRPPRPGAITPDGAAWGAALRSRRSPGNIRAGVGLNSDESDRGRARMCSAFRSDRSRGRAGSRRRLGPRRPPRPGAITPRRGAGGPALRSRRSPGNIRAGVGLNSDESTFGRARMCSALRSRRSRERAGPWRRCLRPWWRRLGPGRSRRVGAPGARHFGLGEVPATFVRASASIRTNRRSAVHECARRFGPTEVGGGLDRGGGAWARGGHLDPGRSRWVSRLGPMFGRAGVGGALGPWRRLGRASGRRMVPVAPGRGPAGGGRRGPAARAALAPPVNPGLSCPDTSSSRTARAATGCGSSGPCR